MLLGQSDLDDEALQNLLVDHLLPWYVSFYLSWLEDEDVLRITYEDVRTAPVDTVERIMAFAGRNISRDQLELVVSNRQALQKQGRDQKVGSRFNKGVSGRGRDISSYAKQRIQALLNHYPDVDFSPIHLTAE